MKKIGFVSLPSSSGHSVRGVGFYARRLLSSLQSQSSKYDLEVIPISNSEIQNTNCQLVHYPYFDLFTNSLDLSPVPTVVTVHDVIPLEFPAVYKQGVRSQINFRLQSWALGGVDRIITDSYASVQSIHKLLKVTHEKIKLVYLAADDSFHPVSDTNLLKNIRQKYSLPEKFVLYVGDLNWNKNLNTLVSVCSHRHLPLVLVGKHLLEVEKMDFHHPELSHLSHFTELLSTNHEIYRLGFVPDEDLPAVYNLSTVYCQPSYAEGFGLPVLEAFACGTPVVCSQTHSLPEIGGEAAVYFNPYDESDLDSQLFTVWQNSDLRKSLSKIGIIQASKFSWDQVAENTLLVYRELI
jgi:glycosyltransferase involved in cell wall biosynthesis